MSYIPYFKFYRVNQNDTTVIPTSCNNFKVAVKAHPTNNSAYCLLPEQERYYGYRDLVLAMEKAKEGALAYINRLINKGETGSAELLKYRVDHYEDLHVNLVDANIRRVEQNLLMDKNFKWQPYHININL